MTDAARAGDGDGQSGEARRRRRPWWPWALAAVIVLALIGKSMYGAVSATERVTALCAEIRAGMPIAELGAFARKNGLGLSAPGEGLNYLPDKASMGRHLCRVQVRAGLVESSGYLFLD